MDEKQCKKISILFKKKKKLVKDKFELAKFKEPVLILMRRGNKAEFFEKATQNEFIFKHSDGSERFIILNPKNLQTFDYGNESFTGYICHEDTPIALPEEPLIVSDAFNMAINKTLYDNNKWKENELRAKGDMIWKIALGASALAGMFILYKLMVPTV